MKRIAVVGVTGSGKTTLAEQVATKRNIPHVELDSIFWGPNWIKPASFDLFREQVANALLGEVWVTCGNYSSAREVVWTRADTLIWLDYDLSLVMLRLFRRSVRRIIRHQVLWNDNRETWRAQFLSRDSLFLLAYKTLPSQRQEYPRLFRRAEYSHLQVLRFRKPYETSEWMRNLSWVDK